MSRPEHPLAALGEGFCPHCGCRLDPSACPDQRGDEIDPFGGRACTAERICWHLHAGLGVIEVFELGGRRGSPLWSTRQIEPGDIRDMVAFVGVATPQDHPY